MTYRGTDDAVRAERDALRRQLEETRGSLARRERELELERRRQVATSGKASTNAIAALVLGIASWAGLGIVAAIPGWIVARREQDAIAEGRSPGEGSGLATAGYWLSLSNLLVSVLVIVLFLLGMLLLAV
jgi:hypothetical protein